MAAPDVPDYSIRISIDRGGTFCDTFASWPAPAPHDRDHRAEYIFKILSQNPDSYGDAPTECVRRVLEHVTGQSIPRKTKLKTDKIDVIRLSTTVGTNALLERKGSDVALVITKGFKDLLEIGNQSRPRIFELAISRPEQLYKKVVEVDERVTLVGYTSDPKHSERQVLFDQDGKVTRGYDSQPVAEDEEIVQGISGEAVQIIKKPDETAIRQELQQLYDQGIRSIAVLLLHSYTYPAHEELIGRIAKEVGFEQISLSSSLSNSIKAVPRGMSATCDAYLTPVLQSYIDGFFSGFDSSLREGVQSGDVNSKTTKVEFMASDGGLSPVNKFSGLKSILSGPAGGVVGAALSCYDSERKIPVIAYDQGGTSTDVSRFDGSFETVFETVTAGIAVVAPQLDINTVASGGSSRLFLRNGVFVVGPESAGSHPGPSAYGKGGPLAITDANLILGRLQPDYFPHIFGKTEDQPLDLEATTKNFEELKQRLGEEMSSGQQEMSLDEIAYGYLKVANETMSKPIRALTEARGFDTTKHVLCAFGGAGGQHACSIAKTLGMKTILIHAYSSVLSAYGMALSDRVVEFREPAATAFEPAAVDNLKQRIDKLKRKARQELQAQGFEDKHVVLEAYLNLRYNGTDTSLFVPEPEDESWDFIPGFEQVYKQEFGFLLNERNIIVDDLRVKGIGKTYSAKLKSALAELDERSFSDLDKKKDADSQVSVYFEPGGRLQTPLYQLDKLPAGSKIRGPALILQETQTIVVDSDATAFVLDKHVAIRIDDGN